MNLKLLHLFIPVISNRVKVKNLFFYLKILEEKKEESKMRCSIKFSAITQYKHLSPNKDVGSLIGLWQSCLFYFVQTIKLIECFLLKEN